MSGTTASRFGRRIVAARRQHGWTLEELAGKSATDKAALSRLENGRRGCLLDTAVNLAAVLGISLDNLAGPCEQCKDSPPAGFSCLTCGAEGEHL